MGRKRRWTCGPNRSDVPDQGPGRMPRSYVPSLARMMRRQAHLAKQQAAGSGKDNKGVKPPYQVVL